MHSTVLQFKATPKWGIDVTLFQIIILGSHGRFIAEVFVTIPFFWMCCRIACTCCRNNLITLNRMDFSATKISATNLPHMNTPYITVCFSNQKLNEDANSSALTTLLSWHIIVQISLWALSVTELSWLQTGYVCSWGTILKGCYKLLHK